MSRRWECRLLTVVAGAGFGKTVLLVGAIADSARLRSGGRDVWLSCEPGDESACHLAHGVAEALGLKLDAGIDAICDAMWSAAPEEICLMLDDVHEVQTGSSGAIFIADLLKTMPDNAHLVVASRETVPVPTARLAVEGRLVTVGEDDLLFDGAELAAFAEARGVDPEVLAPTGGWPALAELTAHTRADLVVDYLWDEVLAGLDPVRATLLAQLAAVGGGDDEVVTALAGQRTRLDDVVASVPLVERSRTGWAALHPLWEPALRRLVPVDGSQARRTAAAVHRRQGRLGVAVGLFAEAEAWDDVLAIIRATELESNPAESGAEIGRWVRLLPQGLRSEPEAIFAVGLEVEARSPMAALAYFEAAASAFRARRDVDAELTVIAADGLVRWWANDLTGIAQLLSRVDELAAAGSNRAQVLSKIGLAGMAHLRGESRVTLDALADVIDDGAGGWAPSVHWLRSVAYRREGELRRARDELLAPGGTPVGRYDLQFEIASLRIDWLSGYVDAVRGRLPAIASRLASEGDRHLANETILELASKTAWLGERRATRDLLDAIDARPDDPPNPLHSFFRLIAQAALCVADGDERQASQLLAAHPLADVDSPQHWYWRDRAALALLHVLRPETRAWLMRQPLTDSLRPGLALAEALEAARQGNLAPIAELAWPDAGIVRAHFPFSWIVELAAAGAAAGNPAPAELLHTLGHDAGSALRAMLAHSANPPIIQAATRMLATIPAVPDYELCICVLGSLEVRRDDHLVEPPDLRRKRVRELLCYLTAHRRVRREQVVAELWPEHDDGAHNLRVTLNYLQRVLQPERIDGAPPYFIRSDRTWLYLCLDDKLEVDAWVLDNLLDRAAAAERANTPALALAAYRTLLPLWRGEPYTDAPYAAWAQPPRNRLRVRYTAAALRAGELLLAAGERADAVAAARLAITAEPSAEPAYRLLAKAHIADGDRAAARRALDDCRLALAELGLEPEAATTTLLASAMP